MISRHDIHIDSIGDSLVLSIEQHKEHTLFVNDNPLIHEAKYQLKEGCHYDFSISSDEYSLRCRFQDSIIKRHKARPSLGTIQPNIFVGTLELEVYEIKNENNYAKLELEVQSVKASYREDYRYMLNYIAQKCTDLILQADSPVSQSLEINPQLDNDTLYQRFAFIKSMIESEEFDSSIYKIMNTPSARWVTKENLSDSRRIKRFQNKQIRSLIHGTNQTRIDSDHPLYKVSNSIALKVRSTESYEDYDTNENRFVKHAIDSYKQFCQEIKEHSNAKSNLKRESKLIIEKLENILQSNFFKSISRPTTLNLNSPLLQRKSGYREQLKLWLQFDLAARLVWEGGDEVYKAGKKDVATLYEYWLFFMLLDVVKEVFSVNSSDIQDLIKPTKDGLGLQLRQGKFTAISGQYNKGSRVLNIRLNYNKSFKGINEVGGRHKEGSWTTTMRPDYTLSIWPQPLTDKQAEEQEQIVHIHFDAKYKISNLESFLNDDLDARKLENRKGMYKNADLLKMHAYKDAIKRTSGAYVLYPGTEDKTLLGFHEILPGLGAFAIAPKEGINPTRKLEDFLNEVLSHFLNRSSQRENIASKTYEITKDGMGNPLMEPLPEYVGKQKLIPNEAYVLVGYIKSKDHLEWINKNQLYNFRTDTDKGALKLNRESFNAKYLLLHAGGDKSSNRLFTIVGNGFRVTKKSTLLRLNYPDPRQDNYLVIEIEPCIDKEFESANWNFKELKRYKSGRASAIPFTVSLRDFLECADNDNKKSTGIG